MRFEHTNASKPDVSLIDESLESSKLEQAKAPDAFRFAKNDDDAKKNSMHWQEAFAALTRSVGCIDNKRSMHRQEAFDALVIGNRCIDEKRLMH